jgi:hypothetical protein
MGNRTIDVMAEIAGCLEITGVSKVDWKRFREKLYGTDKDSNANLHRILVRLEEGGLITRDPGLDSWGMVWVNPIAIRHRNTKPEYYLASVRGWYVKREKARRFKLGDGELPPDPADSLLLINEPTPAEPSLKNVRALFTQAD